MKYTNFGNTGLIVSRLSFGTMTFGQGTLVGDLVNDLDQQTADQMVGVALDAGVNFFDTADGYTGGQSEVILGRALKGKRDHVIIATKASFRTGEALTESGLSYRRILQAVQASLKRLDTDYIDLYQLHIPDPFTPLEETARALNHIVQKGYVRYVGYSNYPAWQAQRLLDIQNQRGYAPLISSQMYYSLLGRDIEHNTIPFLQANGLGLIVWSPLASGFLSGKYTRENAEAAEGRRAKFPFPPIDLEKGYMVVEKMAEIAAQHDASVAQIALAWLLAKPYVSSIIIGASKMIQLEDNLGAVDITLSADEVATLDELTATPLPYPAWMQPMGADEMVSQALRE
ncbi:aldo/keto reductase [Candidatus Leptofilum sp.]|uniref:aldo/keto reductase n=1 Tax=Candidatus Leptofilum sp. TaxID=3241576 RepID=UPI003B590ED4